MIWLVGSRIGVQAIYSNNCLFKEPE